MERILEQNFAISSLGKDGKEDAAFILCNFRNVQFQEARFKNCVFYDCDFSLSSFQDASFERCTFKSCEFINANLDRSKFKECYAYLCTFENAHFGEADFDFIATDVCNFNFIRIPHKKGIPYNCRELAGEIIRQVGDDPQILGLAGLIKTHREFCWESLSKIAESFLSKENYIKVVSQFRKFPNFERVVSKFEAKE